MTSTRLLGHRLYRFTKSMSIPKKTTAAASALTDGPRNVRGAESPGFRLRDERES